MEAPVRPPIRPPEQSRRRAPEGAACTIGTRGGQALPVFVEARAPGLDLAGWAAGERGWIAETLAASGAILFRGFAPIAEAELSGLTAALAGAALPYLYRSTPRTEVGKGIYTATEYPANQRIPLHNENSYQSAWPLRLVFFCPQPAEQGGETPLADMRRVLRRLPPELVERFRTRGVRYVRNYVRNAGEGLDLTWPTVFQTESPAAVESYCRAHSIELSWQEGERLRTWQRRPALAAHPRSGEEVWFNQAHLFHASSLPAEVRASLLAFFPPDELPRNACFGDGAPLPEEDLDAVRAALDAEAVTFPWQGNDLLLVDNMLVAHGRMPFSGRRRVLVAMADLYDPEGGTAS